MRSSFLSFLAEIEPTTRQLVVIGVCALVAIGCVWLQRARGRRVKQLIQRWGGENGIRFTEINNTGLRRGPFKFTANSKNIVVQVTGAGADGTTIAGWIRRRWSLTKLGEYTLTIKWDGQGGEIEHTDMDTDDPLLRAGIQ